MAFMHLKAEEMKGTDLVTEIRIVPVTGLHRYDPLKRLWVANAYSDLFGEKLLHQAHSMLSIEGAAFRLRWELDERLKHGRKV